METTLLADRPGSQPLFSAAIVWLAVAAFLVEWGHPRCPEWEQKTVLAFDERGLLVPGVHDATLKEVEEHFGRFQRSDRRPQLFRKLREYLAEVNKAECASSLIINGSFAMGCVDEPNDIDLILVLPADWDEAADLKPYQYNLVSKRRVKKEFGFDAFTVGLGSRDERRWIEFFSQVSRKWCRQFGWPADTTKGLVRVVI